MSATAPPTLPGPPILEPGGTATAKVTFQDGFGSNVTPDSVAWTASPNHVVVVMPGDDPASASLLAMAQGTTTLTAVGQADGGTATAEIVVQVMRSTKGVPVAGSITLTA
jgi:hypothetical protein